jgi:hypothetical protein
MVAICAYKRESEWSRSVRARRARGTVLVRASERNRVNRRARERERESRDFDSRDEAPARRKRARGREAGKGGKGEIVQSSGRLSRATGKVLDPWLRSRGPDHVAPIT